jgi:hypothetical protein
MSIRYAIPEARRGAGLVHLPTAFKIADSRFWIDRATRRGCPFDTPVRDSYNPAVTDDRIAIVEGRTK